MKYLTQSDGWRLQRTVNSKPIFNKFTQGANTPQTRLGENGQSRLLARFRQIFPFTVFPDEIIIEELRVVWVRKKGPWMSEIISIMATDIACVNASKGLITGEVHIQSVTGGPQIYVDKLHSQNAYKIRDLIEGIALASREGLKLESTNSIEDERQAILRAGQIRPSVY